MPRLSIGMPTRNNGPTLEKAIDSLLHQTFGDFELIISDNCSTDDTPEICRAFVARDNRVRYIRQQDDIGQKNNFHFVLKEARAPYFMWASGDDYWHNTFIEKNMAVLDADSTIGDSVSEVQFTRLGQPVPFPPATQPLMGSVRENFFAYLRDPGDNSRVFGIFRREHLVNSFPTRMFHAWDYALVAGTLRYGKHYRLPETLLIRDLTDAAKYRAGIDRDNRGWRSWMMPLWPFTRYLLFSMKMPLSPRIALALLLLNLRFHRLYANLKYPRYGRLLTRLHPVHNRIVRIVCADALARPFSDVAIDRDTHDEDGESPRIA
jgi:glycosyltransferase involved in cell wall biosynthesis